MEKFAEKLEQYVLPVAHKLGQQPHLSAVRDGFITTMPLSLTGALVVMLSNVFFGRYTLIGEQLNRLGFWDNTVQPFLDVTVLPVLNQIWWGTLALTVLFTIIAISYKMAKQRNEDGLAPALAAVSAYLILLPQTTVVGDTEAWGVISWNSFNSQAIFAGLVMALLVPEIFCWVKRKG